MDTNDREKLVNYLTYYPYLIFAIIVKPLMIRKVKTKLSKIDVMDSSRVITIILNAL